MSLPAATKDISAKPTKNGVTDPVNKVEKDADVQRKIKLYGVITALRAGHAPTNKQIDDTLKYVQTNSPVDLKSLSSDGQKLIQDTRDIIETARLLVQEKNADELFQNFLWHTRDVDLESAKKDPNEVLPVDKTQATEDGRQALAHIRTLLSLVLTNSEVRKLLSDFSLIGRDLLSRAASKAATGIAPSPEALSRVNDSAPQDEFVSEGGRRVGPNETPVLEVNLPGGHTVAQHPKDEFGTGAKVTTSDGQVRSGDAAYAEAKQEGQRLKATGQDQAQREFNTAQREVDDLQSSPDPDVEGKKQGLMDKVRGIRDGLTDRIPQQHKDTANGHFERGKEFLTEEYFPEERRDQFLFRGKKVIIECQKHKDYQESLRWLLAFLEQYADHGSTIADHGKDSGNALTSDPALKQAGTELRTILERFANGQSLSVIIDAANALIDDAKRDPELRDWFKSVDTYVRKVLLDAGYVLEPDCNNQANALRESGRRFFDEKYKGHFDNLFSSVSGWFRAMGEDPLNKRFGEDWARLTRDLESGC